MEELIIRGITDRSITRPWPRLKVIGVWDKDAVRCIVDGVEQGMFPFLTTVRVEDIDFYQSHSNSNCSEQIFPLKVFHWHTKTVADLVEVKAE